MKTLNEFKATADVNESKIPKSFDNSNDATGFMENLGFQLKSKALKDWAQETDRNFDVKSSTVKQLMKVTKEYDKFMSLMYTAE